MAVLTVGAYAASFPEAVNVKALSGTGFELVTAAATGPSDIGWTLNASRQIDGAIITWTPIKSGDFTVRVEINSAGTEGSSNVSGTQDVEQTDIVPLSPPIEAIAVSTVELVIAEL